MIKKKLILTICVIVLLVSIVYALDNQTIIPCGGDDELVIGCLGDDEDFFIGNVVIEEVVIPPTSGEEIEPEPEIIIIEEEPTIFYRISEKIKEWKYNRYIWITCILILIILALLFIIAMICYNRDRRD